MRLHHIVFGSAAITGAFAFAAPMAWDRHVGLVALVALLTLLGLVLATGSKLADLVFPRRAEHYSRRDVNRAFDDGWDYGASVGPSDETRRRWQRQDAAGPF